MENAASIQDVEVIFKIGQVFSDLKMDNAFKAVSLNEYKRTLFG